MTELDVWCLLLLIRDKILDSEEKQDKRYDELYQYAIEHIEVPIVREEV